MSPRVKPQNSQLQLPTDTLDLHHRLSPSTNIFHFTRPTPTTYTDIPHLSPPWHPNGAPSKTAPSSSLSSKRWRPPAQASTSSKPPSKPPTTAGPSALSRESSNPPIFQDQKLTRNATSQAALQQEAPRSHSPRHTRRREHRYQPVHARPQRREAQDSDAERQRARWQDSDSEYQRPRWQEEGAGHAAFSEFEGFREGW